MSARAVLACDRDWTPGDPCRQAVPVGEVTSLEQARTEAARLFGWSHDPDAGDACETCTRRERERAVRQLPPAARALAASQLVDAGLLDPAVVLR